MNIELIERLTAVHKSLVEQSGVYMSQANPGRYIETSSADRAIKNVLDSIVKLTCESSNV